MSMLKIWIHLVWATKSRKPLLDKNIRQKVWQHMRSNAQEKEIYIDFINGHVDHVHILISLNADQTIAKTVQLIKRESSFWINKNNLCSEKFEWQDDYLGVSVSESGVNAVREYIKNQEAHYAKKTFQQEYDEFMKKYEFQLMKEFKNHEHTTTHSANRLAPAF